MLALKEQTDHKATHSGAEIPVRAAATLSSRTPVSAPLQTLADGALSTKFRAWRGATGRRYIFSVYDRQSVPIYSGAVLVVAAALPDGDRQILFAADTGCFPDMVVANAAARFTGELEFHVHLLATSAEARRALIADICHAGLS